AERQVWIKIGGFVTVAALDGRGKRPAEIAVSGQRKQEGANELPVSQPDRISRLALVEGKNVDENRLRVAEQNVQRSRVLENEPGGQGFFAKIECQLARGGPLSRRPLPRIGGVLDAFVLEQQRAVRLTACDDGRDHPAALDPFPGERGI